MLREDPEVGVHAAVSADRLKTVERRLGGDVLQELAVRIAGSGADQQDLSAVSGQYGDVPPLRLGQLLIGDLMRGSAKRVRGYTLLTGNDKLTTRGA